MISAILDFLEFINQTKDNKELEEKETPALLAGSKLKFSIKTEFEYEVLMNFFYRDEKFALLCRRINDKLVDEPSILNVLNPTLIVDPDKDPDAYVAARRLYDDFKINNQDKFAEES